MTSTLLVAVTEAPVARRAIDWAAQRAADRHQAVELMSVIGGAVGAVGEHAVIEAAMAARQSVLEADAERIAARGIPVRVRVERGNPVARLVDASTDAALLVIGSDGRGPGTGYERGVHGVRIAAGAHCPVVVVPDRDLEGRAGVVVGVDGSEVSEHALAFAAAEADRLGEPLTVVTVWSPIVTPHNPGVYPPEYLANMQALSEEAMALAVAGLSSDYPDLEVVRHVEQGYPSAVLNRLGAQARLVVVGSHGRGAIARFLLGSISEEVLAHLATVTAIVR